MTDAPLVLVERHAPTATVTINRAASLNTLTAATLDALEAVLRDLATDPAVRAIVLTGAGERAFVAGADINELNALADSAAAEAFARRADRLFQLLDTMPKATIAAVNGFALGGGCELAMACDIRIAADTARLGQPEVNYGILAGWGGTQRLPRLVGKGMAKYLLFTGEIITAQEALRIGLVERVVPAAELQAQARALADLIASKGPVAIARTKAAVNLALDTALEEGLARESAEFGATFDTHDRKEGTSAFLEKRPAQFTGT